MQVAVTPAIGGLRWTVFIAAFAKRRPNRVLWGGCYTSPQQPENLCLFPMPGNIIAGRLVAILTLAPTARMAHETLRGSSIRWMRAVAFRVVL
jgi:hypothetical protein